MTVTRVSSREFNQASSRVKKAAEEGPVIITDRGKPAYVILKYDVFQKLSGDHKTLADCLAMPEAEVEFDPPRVELAINPAEFD
ncbi:MAG TPA: type II toxin-antitoxin system Phd/YefM family antitoxin [Gammaproteobacteria bacterium]|nr:type II toxin-antitoxin system Phd/YefM family antitoxin [Gammaproteobacteria bacterium]